MASENETVAEIRENVHEYLTSIGPSEYPDEEQFEEFADRFVAAHKREMDAVLKDRDEMYRSEQETVAKTKAWFEDYQSIRREVAELRECLVRRSSHLNAILQKALELRNGVPSELRKVMDECIVAEDMAIGLGVFSKKGAEDEGRRDDD